MGVLAPPPSRVAAAPPSSDPAPQSPRSGPAAAAVWPVATPTSTAPKTTPTATRMAVSVRMPGAASAPPRCADRSCAGRQPLDAGWRANATVASSTPAGRDHERATGRRDRRQPERDRRTGDPGRTPRASPGPRDGRPHLARIVQDVRQQRPAGRPRPAACTRRAPAARPAATPTPVPAGSDRVATSSAVDAPAPASSTPVWPRRSTIRPSDRAADAERHGVGRRRRGRPPPPSRSAGRVHEEADARASASGSRANVEVTKRRRALADLGDRLSCADARVYWCR